MKQHCMKPYPMKTAKRTILLVENDPDLSRAVARRLRMAGYTVYPAATLAAAQEQLDKEIIHLAIIDIRATNDRSSGDRSGFAFAHSLPDNIPFLFHTAHDTKEHIREALGEIGAGGIIAKEDPDGPAKMMATVQLMFTERVGINFGLTLTSSIALAHIATEIRIPTQARQGASTEVHAAAGNKTTHDDTTDIANDATSSAASPTGEDIEILVRRLLPEALTVHLTPLLQSELQRDYSLSGAVLLRVHETRNEGCPVPMVLKLGPTTMIGHEAAHYRRIQPYLGGQRLARLEGEAHSRQIGGLLYTLVSAQDWESLDTLGSYIQRESSTILQATITRFLQQSFGNIYQEAQPAKLDLTVHYTKELGLTPEKLQHAVERWQPEGLTTNSFVFAQDEVVPNPIRWALEGGYFRNWGALETYTTLCHGDLHCRNILVDHEGHCWLIDFGRAGRSHFLRDFVELEVDLRLQLIVGASAEAIIAFEQALASQRLTELVIAPPHLSTALAKAYQLIGTVRQNASLLTAQQAKHHEYEQALFWHLLNALRLRSLTQEQKSYALYVAGLLTRSLPAFIP